MKYLVNSRIFRFFSNFLEKKLNFSNWIFQIFLKKIFSISINKIKNGPKWLKKWSKNSYFTIKQKSKFAFEIQLKSTFLEKLGKNNKIYIILYYKKTYQKEKFLLKKINKCQKKKYRKIYEMWMNYLTMLAQYEIYKLVSPSDQFVQFTLYDP